jgi:hypothetical protein
MECPSCISDLDHCHGTLVVHLDEVVECTEPRCVDPDRLRHQLIIDCQQIDGGCDCTMSIETKRLKQAS